MPPKNKSQKLSLKKSSSANRIKSIRISTDSDSQSTVMRKALPKSTRHSKVLSSGEHEKKTRTEFCSRRRSSIPRPLQASAESNHQLEIIDRLLKERKDGEIKVLSPSSSDQLTAPEENFMSNDEPPADISKRLFSKRGQN